MPATSVLALLSGSVAGVLSGVFGIGGGIVLVPMLGLLLGLSQVDAQGVTLAVLLLPVGLPAVLAYRRRVAIPWRLVAATIAGFVVAVGPGARIATALDGRLLRTLFAGMVVIVAVRTWRQAGARGDGEVGKHAPPRSAWNGTWIGATGGLLAGLLGIGGGIVMIPLLVGVQGLDQREAQAVSLAVMLPPVGLPGVLAYAQARGALPWGVMALVAAGFAVGALGGARLAVRARTATLSRAFAAFLLVAAARMAWTALRAGPGP